MANTQWGGSSARFGWGTGFTEFTHLLALELQEVRPAHRKTRFVAESIDYATRVVTTIGSGVYEAVAVIRFDAEGGSLTDLFAYWMDGNTVRYWPDYGGAPGTYHDLLLIEPTELDEIGFDDDQKTFDEHSIQIRIRRTDGASLSGLL